MKDSINKRQLRQFGFLVGVGMPFLIGWLIPTVFGHGFRVWTIWISIPAISLALTFPNSLYYPYKAWMALGHALGFINSRIILGLVFLCVLQPIALIMRLTGYDPLKKSKTSELTYREITKFHKTDLKRIF